MKFQLFVAILVLLFAKRCTCLFVNNRPIIGVVTEEFPEYAVTPLESSFMRAFYVKYLEGSGARVAPILIYKSEEYYRDILGKVNGVLLPGGGDLLGSPGYGRTGKIIFDMAVKMNEEGDYFPLWGTCLGFELLNVAAAGNKSWMKPCSAEDWTTGLDLAQNYNSSRMFANLPADMKNTMLNEKMALHLHHWCITPQNYSLSGLDKYFRVLALNKDAKNETFISVIEAFRHPFFGVSFHPERILFDWKPRNISTPHTAEAVKISQFFGNFFVNEARKNSHRFQSKDEEISWLIYNYSPHIGRPDPSDQMYLFP